MISSWQHWSSFNWHLKFCLSIVVIYFNASKSSWSCPSKPRSCKLPLKEIWTQLCHMFCSLQLTSRFIITYHLSHLTQSNIFQKNLASFHIQDLEWGGFGEILPEVMIFPRGFALREISTMRVIFRRIPWVEGL